MPLGHFYLIMWSSNLVIYSSQSLLLPLTTTFYQASRLVTPRQQYRVLAIEATHINVGCKAANQIVQYQRRIKLHSRLLVEIPAQDSQLFTVKFYWYLKSPKIGRIEAMFCERLAKVILFTEYLNLSKALKKTFNK